MSDREDKFAPPGSPVAGSGRIRTKRMLTEDGHVEELLNSQDVAVCAVDQHHKSAQAAVARTQELLQRAQETFDTISYLSSHVGEPLEEYIASTKTAIATVRDARMALQTETRQLLVSLREVREFFLGDDKHEQEVKRLLEFVELCERLKRLQDSGFLDTIADTMLRLSEK